MQHHEVVRRQVSVVDGVGTALRFRSLGGGGRTCRISVRMSARWRRETHDMRAERNVGYICRRRRG